MNVTFNLRDKKYNSNENMIMFLAIEKTRTGFKETTQCISGNMPDCTTQSRRETSGVTTGWTGVDLQRGGGIDLHRL